MQTKNNKVVEFIGDMSYGILGEAGRIQEAWLGARGEMAYSDSERYFYPCHRQKNVELPPKVVICRTLKPCSCVYCVIILVEI